MRINWKVRLKNKTFWLTAIPAVLLLVQQVLVLFGVELNLADLEAQLLAIVGAVFSLLAVLGVVVDPTTAGLDDSTQAQLYDEPRKG